MSEEKKKEILDSIHDALREIPEQYQADVGKSITHDIGVMAKTIGIVTAKEISSDIENMGYAIPSNLVLALVNNILRNCEGSSNMNVLKPIMGITITSYVSGLVVDPESGDFYEANLVYYNIFLFSCFQNLF